MRKILSLGLLSLAAFAVTSACSTPPADDQGGGNEVVGSESAALSSGIGGACTTSADCAVRSAACFRDSTWVNGYCVSQDCQVGTCAAGSACFRFSDARNRCLATCAGDADCRPGYACKGTTLRACVPGTPAPTTWNGPGAGPGPACPDLPPRDCVGSAAYCSQLVAFNPQTGPGYWNYPHNGETNDNHWRSYIRRDLMMLVKHAAALVACKAASWGGGNGQVLDLGDMSEATGATPGTSIGQPGHPAGTHVNGNDIDIAYYQFGSGAPDNQLRPVCPHTLNGVEQNHCTGDPTSLDLWRSALYIGTAFSSPVIRVIGNDGRIGPKMLTAMNQLCATGWLAQASCDTASQLLGYEPVDTGNGWYYFHHHHFHISLKPLTTKPQTFVTLLPNGEDARPAVEAIRASGALGHALVE